ncbi:2545_t:CDS:2 [Scutellospora calospora]|uniref:2545_t:CDS:1 n=1 Tax=Scutellospora calospora TaxID=85575 RepID=A0ACA9K080_9GLOM|nr:2545_t:CDS:2 [Scutellospora calospora]
MTYALNELIEKTINERNEIIKYDYNLFDNFKEISKGSFGTVRKATWGDNTVILKSLNIDTNKIISDEIIDTNKIINNEIIDTNKIINNEIIDTNKIINNEIIDTNKIITDEIIANKINATEINVNEIINNETKNEIYIKAFVNEPPNGKNKRSMTLRFKKAFAKEVQAYENSEIPQSNDIFSTIITAEHVKEIISWIDPSPQDVQHELKLIFRGSRDGFKASDFYNKCKDIVDTIIVLKAQKTGEILGGYNPLNWKEIKRRKYKETDASFIFSLGTNDQLNSTLSRIKIRDKAICCKKNFGPSFGFLDLYMSRKNEKFWGCFKANYEKSIKIEGSEFLIEDYEVFQYF